MAALLGPVAAFAGTNLTAWTGAAAPLGGLPARSGSRIAREQLSSRRGVVAAGPTLPPGVAAALPGVVAALIVWPSRRDSSDWLARMGRNDAGPELRRRMRRGRDGWMTLIVIERKRRVPSPPVRAHSGFARRVAT